MMMLSKRPRGFTMIELIVVIVILGILAATALPKFIDLSGDAKTAALEGVASSMASAMTINYAGCMATGNSTAGAHATKCTAVRYCDDIEAALQAPLDTTQYTVNHADLSVVNGTTGTCTMTQVNGGNTLQFRDISAGHP